MLPQAQAEVSGASRVAEIIIGNFVVSIQPVIVEIVIETADRSVEICPTVESLVLAGIEVERQVRSLIFLLARTAEKLNDARHSIRAEQGRLWSAHNFNAVQIGRR